MTENETSSSGEDDSSEEDEEDDDSNFDSSFQVKTEDNRDNKSKRV